MLTNLFSRNKIGWSDGKPQDVLEHGCANPPANDSQQTLHYQNPFFDTSYKVLSLLTSLARNQGYGKQ